ncbi:beta-lactamase family protein, partial [Brenneria goodwinii]
MSEISPSVSEPTSPNSALSARLDAVIEQAIAEQRIVGAVVIVRRHGKDAYRGAAGLADRESGRPMTEATLFRLASVSKPIVATAAMALVAQ